MSLKLILFGTLLMLGLSSNADDQTKIQPKRVRTKKVQDPTCKDLDSEEFSTETFLKILSLSDLGTYIDSPLRMESKYFGNRDAKPVIKQIDELYLHAVKILGWTESQAVTFAASPQGRKFTEMLGGWLISYEDPNLFRATIDKTFFSGGIRDSAITWLLDREPPQDVGRWRPLVFSTNEEIEAARKAIIESELSNLAKKYLLNGFDLKFTDGLKEKILATNHSIKMEVRDLGSAIAKAQLRRDFANKVKTTVDVDNKGSFKFSQE